MNAQADPAERVATLPYAIFCSIGETTFIAYLARIEPDGTAVYANANGTFARVGSDRKVIRGATALEGDCHGRTLEDLRANGKAVPFPLPTP